ncbi:surface antigen D15 [Candidatus Magnetomorum sp. HK-1]|nr:surface antigen D15 [Candidatus Magnetomorum sp. HK-1]
MQIRLTSLIIGVFLLYSYTGLLECQAEQEPLPDKTLESTTDSPLLLPPLKEDTDQHLSSAASVYIKKFKLDGNTVYSDEDLAFIVSPYEERKISSEELHDVKNKISLFYYTNGYVNSGAVIPDQKVSDGYITIKIIEGVLPKITVTGNSWLKSNYVSRRLEIATGDGKAPLNINVLQDRLKIIKQNPRVENINANLSPGLKLGEAELEVTIKEARPYFLTFEVNNYNSPSVGAYRGDIIFEHINLTGWGDSIRLKYGITEGLDTYSSKYEIPLNRSGTSFYIEADRSKSVVVAQPFGDFDIKGDTTTMGGGFKHPFYKSVSSEFLMGVKFEHRKSNTEMLGQNWSFTEGVNNGESKVSVIRFSQEWIQRSLEQVIAARSTVSFGLDILDATKVESTDPTKTIPNATFAAWLGQFQWIRRIAETQIIARLDMRISDSPLLSIEKFAIGGHATVRGYRENVMTPDNGLVASLEWRIPVAHWNIPALTKNQKQGMVYLAPFFDFGKGTNTRTEDPEPGSISSIGIGFRWSISENFYSEVYWGHALRDIEQSTEYDLQDDGLHFQISANVFD